MCDLALPKILNSDETTVDPASLVDTAIAIQENEMHREDYELKVTFKDNYGRDYSWKHAMKVGDHSTWETGTTEWRT